MASTVISLHVIYTILSGWVGSGMILSQNAG